PPRVEVVADGLPRREVVRQAPPLAPGPGQVEDRIDDVLAVVDPGPTGSPRRPVAVREEVVDVGPLEVRQVTRVGLPCAHAKRINSTPGHWKAQFLDGLLPDSVGDKNPYMGSGILIPHRRITRNSA